MAGEPTPYDDIPGKDDIYEICPECDGEGCIMCEDYPFSRYNEDAYEDYLDFRCDAERERDSNER